jgi:hypothetical protein
VPPGRIPSASPAPLVRLAATDPVDDRPGLVELPAVPAPEAGDAVPSALEAEDPDDPNDGELPLADRLRLSDPAPDDPEPPGAGACTDGGDGVETVGAGRGLGTRTGGGVGLGIETGGIGGVGTEGVETVGVGSEGVETDGVVVDGTETTGVDTDGTESVGTVRPWLGWG